MLELLQNQIRARQCAYSAL